jgi:hypothetical protein
MVEELGMLADEIAALKLYSEQIPDPVARGIAEQMARLLAVFLEDFIERETILSGEMPWWQQWELGQPLS